MYGKEAIMPMDYIVHILRVAEIIQTTDVDVMEDMSLQLVQLEEERFVARFH